MNIKRATIHNYQQLNKKTSKLWKQLEQEQNHGYGDHLEGYQLGGRKGRMGEKVQGLKSIIGRYRIDWGRLRIVEEMEKPKSLYAQPMDMN